MKSFFRISAVVLCLAILVFAAAGATAAILTVNVGSPGVALDAIQVLRPSRASGPQVALRALRSTRHLARAALPAHCC